jgi:hypothetical protein
MCKYFSTNKKRFVRLCIFCLHVNFQEKTKNARRRNIKALADILDGMDQITNRTTWAQAQRLLVENPAYAKDPELQSKLLSALSWIKYKNSIIQELF